MPELHHIITLALLILFTSGALAVCLMWLWRLLAFPWCGIGEEISTFEDAGARFRFVILPAFAIGVSALLITPAVERLWLADPLRKPIEQLSKIEIALQALMDKSRGSKPVEPELGYNLVELTTAVGELEKSMHSWSPLPPLDGLVGRMDAINQTLNTIAEKIMPSSASPASGGHLEDIANNLKSIEVALGNRDPSGSYLELLQHINLIEAVLLEPVKPAGLCEQMASVPDLSDRTESEKALQLFAQHQHLSLPGKYRVTRYRLFFDPQRSELSDLGRRAMFVVLRYARDHKLAVVIRAEVDGAEPETLARQRADAIAAYLNDPPAVPVAAIVLLPVSDSTSEPYRRVVHLDLLESCEPLLSAPSAR